jgi:GH18 family chitinase
MTEQFSHISHLMCCLCYRIDLMSYDFHGAFSATTGTNAPLYYQGWGEEGFSVHDCVANWLAGGATKNKINIGLPFYGRSFATATELNAPHDGADQVVWGIDDGTPQYFVRIIDSDFTMTFSLMSTHNFISYTSTCTTCCIEYYGSTSINDSHLG